MTKLKVGVNDSMLAIHLAKAESKKKLANEILGLCEQFITIDNKLEFLTDVTGNFEVAFNEQFAEVLNPRIVLEKRYMLMDVDMKLISALAKQYASNTIQLDESLECETPDFAIYLTDEKEIKAYKERIALIKAIEKFEGQGHNVNLAKVLQAFPNSFHYDFSANKFNAVH